MRIASDALALQSSKLPPNANNAIATITRANDKPSQRGRPTSFQEWMLPCAEVLYELGATNKDVARAFQINEDTIYTWLQTRPDFSETQKGKDAADAEVVRSLYRRAKGYEIDGQHIPAHPTAIIFWLKNRQAAKWRDRTEVQAHVQTANADPEAVKNQLVTMATQYPTLNPIIRKLAQDLLDGLPVLSG